MLCEYRSAAIEQWFLRQERMIPIRGVAWTWQDFPDRFYPDLVVTFVADPATPFRREGYVATRVDFRVSMNLIYDFLYDMALRYHRTFNRTDRWMSLAIARWTRVVEVMESTAPGDPLARLHFQLFWRSFLNHYRLWNEVFQSPDQVTTIVWYVSDEGMMKALLETPHTWMDNRMSPERGEPLPAVTWGCAIPCEWNLTGWPNAGGESFDWTGYCNICGTYWGLDPGQSCSCTCPACHCQVPCACPLDGVNDL